MDGYSEIFKSTAGVYLRNAIRFHLKWMIVIFIILCFLSIVLAFNDIRWFFVSLILIFLIFPFIIFNAYFFYLLTPEARRALNMKRVKFKANGDIIIEYFESDEDDNMTVPSFQEIISTKDIYGLEIRNKNLLVRLKKSKLGFLIIPVNSLNEKTLEKLRQRIQSINVDS